MKDNEQLQRRIHHSMALIGGYLGIYAILCRGDFLGNAQTSNLIYLVHSLCGRNWLDVGLRLIAVFLYMAGIALTVLVSKRWHGNLHIVSLCVTSIAVCILGLLPADVNNVVGLFPIFFAMAVQWNSFPGACGYVSSSIFSTNNVRQVATALTEYAITHDKKQLHKAKFFAETLLCFHLGVVVSIATHHFFGVRSVWFCYALLLLSGSLVAYETVSSPERLAQPQITL
jgi:uncharacterized membrane protein YoaK (UPF0700 family)